MTARNGSRFNSICQPLLCAIWRSAMATWWRRRLAGRSAILDDLSPLRQLNAQVAAAPAHLFQPAEAVRLRRDANSDTPMPPEIPAGTNPPAGAILDYTLRAVPSQPIKLAIFDTKGNLVRQFSSAPIPESVRRPEKLPRIADYWMANPQPLPTHIGMNRFIWDLRYSPPPSVEHSYPMSAIPYETPAGPEGPLVVLTNT